VIEFEDAEHDKLMHAIAARLGFDLVSVRLELFARKHAAPVERPAAKTRAAKPAPAEPRVSR